jgi:DNA-binding transcriptional LysR family regulator
VGVEIRDLKRAIVAAQHRSLRQAAEALDIRQTTLSRRLRDLEYQLGATLFERTNGGTRPTVPGQEFLDAARRIVEETEAITPHLKTRSRGESGRLTNGVHASLSAGNLRATLIEHRRRFPDVQTHRVDGSSDHLISDLASWGCKPKPPKIPPAILKPRQNGFPGQPHRSIKAGEQHHL